MKFVTIPKLSVLCLAFNHVHFIRQTLDGFVMQQTNFPFEVLIHDDASIDGTAEIIREYEAKYPEIIKPIYQTENQWSKGVPVSKKFQFSRVQGQYVAMCEGDDYWTDPLKLQKQVDFLDAHPDYSVCFHPVEVHWEDEPSKDDLFPTPEWRYNKTTLTADDLVKHNFMQTNSVMYRWVFPELESVENFPDGILPGDWFLHLMHAKHGKIGFLPDVMAVYRRHNGGIWQNHPLLRYCDKHLLFFDAVDILFDGKYHEILTKQKEGLVRTLFLESVEFRDFKMFEKILNVSPSMLDYMLRHLHVPKNEFTWRHRLVNKLAKLLGLAPPFQKFEWL